MIGASHLHALHEVRIPVAPTDLVPSDVAAWRALRTSLERRRFRRDPDAYPQSLENSLINQALPS